MSIEHPIRHQSGFSLEEALIALTLLTTGLLTLAEFQGRIYGHGSQARVQTAAVNLAQQKLEQLRLQSVLDYSGLASGEEQLPATERDSTRFRRTWSVSPHSSPDYTRVEVVTEWETRDGERQSVSIRGRLSQSPSYAASDWSRARVVPE